MDLDKSCSVFVQKWVKKYGFGQKLDKDPALFLKKLPKKPQNQYFPLGVMLYFVPLQRETI